MCTQSKWANEQTLKTELRIFNEMGPLEFQAGPKTDVFCFSHLICFSRLIIKLLFSSILDSTEIKFKKLLKIQTWAIIHTPTYE